MMKISSLDGVCINKKLATTIDKKNTYRAIKLILNGAGKIIKNIERMFIGFKSFLEL